MRYLKITLEIADLRDSIYKYQQTNTKKENTVHVKYNELMLTLTN
jgi:hypothetical protein